MDSTERLTKKIQQPVELKEVAALIQEQSRIYMI